MNYTIHPTEVRLYSDDDEVTDQYEVLINDDGSFTLPRYRGDPPITDFSIDGPAGHNLRHRFLLHWAPDGSDATLGPMTVSD